ncbi:MAG: hypothetical protein AB7P04_07765 [Bacteriovoracia bacterium]
MQFRYGIVGLMAGITGAVSPWSVLAANLTAPVDLESSAVLPENVRSPQFKNVYMAPEEKFDGSGSVVPLGQPLNKTVSWQDIINAQTTDVDKNLVQGTLGAAGLSVNGSPGATTGQVNTAIDVMAPVLAWGITDRLTLAAAVPIYKVDINANTGFVRSSDGQRWVDSVCASEPLKCNEAANKLNDSVNQKLTSLGYEPIRSQSFTSLGDVKLVGKYLLMEEQGRQAVTIKPVLTLPTGRAPDVNKALDVPTGDGQADLGATVIWERAIGWPFRVTSFAGYNLQFSDRLSRRIPTSADDPLSADVEVVDRNLGDQLSIGSMLGYGSTTQGLSLHAGYTYQYQGGTSFGGARFSRARYDFLESQNAYQDVHSLTIAAGFATIDWFKEKKFVYPFQARLVFSKPLYGHNVVTSAAWIADLVAFF